MAKKYTDKQIIQEADKIFVKLNPGMAMRDGSHPAAGPMMSKEYNKEYGRILKQVGKTRRSMN